MAKRILIWLGLAAGGFLALLGLITVIDLVTAGPGGALNGASPVYKPGERVTQLGGRIVRFPPLLNVGTRRAAVLEEDYFFCSRAGQVIRVPRGFKTDFASIPPFAQFLIDRFGSTIEPSGIHDWLYAVGRGGTTEQQQTRRYDADTIFLEALEDNGVGLATRWIMFWAVRLGGAGPYDNSNKPEEWQARIVDPVTKEPFPGLLQPEDRPLSPK